MDYITIIQGDDTNFINDQFIVVNFNTDIDLSGFTATFSLGDVTLSYGNLSEKMFEIILSNEITSNLKLGKQYGELKLIDTSNRIRTITSIIPFLIKKGVNESITYINQTLEITTNINNTTIDIKVETAGISTEQARNYLSQMQNLNSSTQSFANSAQNSALSASNSADNIQRTILDLGNLDNAISETQQASSNAKNSALISQNCLSDVERKCDYIENAIDEFNDSLESIEKIENKGTANGYCPLNSNAIVPSENLPNIIANNDLLNLSVIGNNKLYYQPFAINSGTVENGENSTLYAPGSETIIRNFVQPTLTADKIMGTSDFACTCNHGTAYYAFDNNSSTYAGIYGNNSYTCELTFYNKYPLKITTLTIVESALGITKLEYSDDNSTWTQIESATYTPSNQRTTTWTLSNDTGFHNYYKLSSRNQNGTTNVLFYQVSITGMEQISVSTADIIYCEPCIITTADGRTKQFTETSSIKISSFIDGDYSILKDFSTGALSLSNLLISPIEPLTPTSGDYWLDNSQLPLVLNIFNGLTWNTDNSKVFLGKCFIENGIVTALQNNSFNDIYSLADNICRYIAPSQKYINLTLGATSSKYTAPANGWFVLQLQSDAANRNISMSSGGILNNVWCPVQNNNYAVSIYAKKYQQVTVWYNGSPTIKNFKFYYAEGSKGEAE